MAIGGDSVSKTTLFLVGFIAFIALPAEAAHRNVWADGLAYIMQCPIQTGNSYAYDFNVTGERGTLWWHAHILWLRDTVYGAIVIIPKPGTPFPYPKPNMEQIVVLGEWWHPDVEEIVRQGTKMGLPPNMSDAHTINGKPRPLFPCSEKHTFAMEVESRKTYLLRIVNTALNDELFFTIAGHNMKVVEVDAAFHGRSTSCRQQTATEIFQYKGIPNTVLPTLPQLPAPNDTDFALSYNKTRRAELCNFPANVPLKVDRKLFYKVANLGTAHGTRLSKIDFNSTVELVLQDTNLLTVESHPFHLHGYNLFVVGTGTRNFDPVKDPLSTTWLILLKGTPSVFDRGLDLFVLEQTIQLHTGWGLKMAFVVEDGKGADQSILPPPKDLPPC
ncbi:Tubby-like F-box protein 5 isoform 1 [Hibiscus syriacus]|uniref:Tubby-like F-box protein 5 isoform 1 n=1 Tax=Hibiscus syriacus TaxID=106335 RepID=A0A6A2XF65_HIBSY|nr:Tubby-like F-box protein 5 isoform 1 [Hibiscus syriacus]